MPAKTKELFPEKKKLFLLDGMALTYRAHFALIRSPRFTSSGLCTSAVYGIAKTLPIAETAPTFQPVSLYGATKLACEALVTAAWGTSVRLANVYGPGMGQANVVSTILAQIPGTGPLRVRDGAPVRDFLWIDDAVAGLIAMVDRTTTGIYNLGSGQGVAIRELADMALEAAGECQRPLEETRPSDRASYLALDIAATESVTRWRPQVTAKEGMTRLVLNSGPRYQSVVG